MKRYLIIVVLAVMLPVCAIAQSSMTDEQVMEFQGGLKAVNVDQYILISETDAAAISFGYFRDLNHEFDTAPTVVMFVGVGFVEAQVFVVRFSQVCLVRILNRRTNMRF